MFDYIKGRDCNFESSSSSQLQPLRLLYSHNVATKSLVLIFVNTFRVFEDTDQAFIKKGKEAYHLFSNEGLNFDEIHLYQGLGAGQIVEKFDMLQIKVGDFEKNKKPCDTFIIAIVTIGYAACLETDRQLLFATNRQWQLKKPDMAYDNSEFYGRYSYTQKGGLAVSEYACRLACEPSVHVLQLDSIKSLPYTKTEEFVLQERPGRYRHMFGR